MVAKPRTRRKPKGFPRGFKGQNVLYIMTSLTIITFNMWADPHMRDKRAEWVYENIIQQKPDIILFQEVSNGILLDLIDKLRQAGYQYKVANDNRKTYEMICSRWPIVDHKFKRFSTSIHARGILWADIKTNHHGLITVASAQLDQSDREYSKRIGQLNCVLDFLENSPIVILGCDTGFLKGEYYDGSNTGNTWRDAWIEAGKNKFAQYTVDSNRNKYAKNISRPDRIYYKGFAEKEPTFELMGTDTEEAPSVHFGIKIKI